MKTTHDRLVDIVSDELAERGWNDIEQEQNVYRSSDNRLMTDADVVAYKQNYGIAVECKTKPDIGKAEDQLNRVQAHYFSDNRRIFTLMASYEDIESEEVFYSLIS